MKRVFAIIVATSIAALTSACLTTPDRNTRLVAASEDYGVAIDVSPEGRIAEVYVEGPVGDTLPLEFTAETGATPDARQYLRLTPIYPESRY